MSALIGGLLFSLGVIVIILTLGYIVAKMKTGESLELSFRSFLLAYFYLIIIASILVTSVGVANLVQAGMGAALGKEFSYWVPPAPVFAEPPTPGAAPAKPAPPTEQQQAERLDRQFREGILLREGILQGTSMTIIGGIILGLHWWGRRRLSAVQQGGLEVTLHKAHLMILLAIYSVVGLIALPWGIFELLRYYIVPTTDRFSSTTPGSVLSIALVFVPLWVYFLVSVVEELRRGEVPQPIKTVGSSS